MLPKICLGLFHGCANSMYLISDRGPSTSLGSASPAAFRGAGSGQAAGPRLEQSYGPRFMGKGPGPWEGPRPGKGVGGREVAGGGRSPGGRYWDRVSCRGCFFLRTKKFFEKRKYAKGTAALSVRARSRKQPLPSTGAGMSGRDAATHGPPPGSKRGRAAEIRSRRNSCFLLN